MEIVSLLRTVCLLGLAATLAGAFPAAPAGAEGLVMPRELVDFAKTAGCTPIQEFYERDGMINPPYIYGVLPGDPEKSVAFWCQRIQPSSKKYLLVFKVSDPTALKGCPDRIEWWNPPAGLSIDRPATLRLQDFRLVTDPKRQGPVITVKGATVIVNAVDGLTERFVCFEHAWFVNSTE